MNNQYPEYDKEIVGLCPDKCSCDVCRAARIKDEGYQEYLLAKWKHESVLENRRTMENAIAHDKGSSRIFGHGNVNAVNFFLSYNRSTNKYENRNIK